MSDKHVVLYDVVVTTSIKLLPSLVNESIQQGWQPYGNVVADPDERIFAQPIVKYGSPPLQRPRSIGRG